MFDIGFPELMLVSIVSLLIIGPERLPETIRTLSLWLGRLRRNFHDLKAEIESEIGADEIRQQLHNESVMKSLKETKDQIETTIQETKRQLSDFDIAEGTAGNSNSGNDSSSTPVDGSSSTSADDSSLTPVDGSSSTPVDDSSADPRNGLDPATHANEK